MRLRAGNVKSISHLYMNDISYDAVPIINKYRILWANLFLNFEPPPFQMIKGLGWWLKN